MSMNTGFSRVLGNDRFFQRIATLPVFLNTDIKLETVAVMVTVSEDGEPRIYTKVNNS